MKPSAIYLFPAIIDLVVALMQFVSTVRAPKLGADATGTGLVLMIWSLLYLPSCYVLGRVVTAKNAGNFLQASCLLLATVSGAFLLSSSLDSIYLLMGLTGIGTALFFVPFQIFMKAVDEGGNRSLAYTTACYTLAWSTGYALAPLIAGNLMMLGPISPSGETIGWKFCYVLSGTVCLMAAAGIHFVRNRSMALPTVPVAREFHAIDYERMPNYAALAWLVGGVGILAYSAVRSVFQAYAFELSISDGVKGTILFVLSMTQAVVGFSFFRSRFWMYRWQPIFALGLCGLAGMACFAFGGRPLAFLMGAGLYGIYSGAQFFYFTFHALTHKAAQASHVAVNEIVFGSAALAGPLIGGILADHVSLGFPYLCFGVLLLASLVFQAAIIFRARALVDLPS